MPGRGTPRTRRTHPPGAVATAHATPPEAELARLWAAQDFTADALVTTDGAPLAVAYPGRPGGGAGPDFRDAVLQFGDGPAQVGDVELHRDARDFVHHGHTADPAYDNVLLHVVFAAQEGERTTLASGRQPPLLVVPPARRAARPAPLREPCAAAPGRLGAEPVRAVLREAGLWRLRRKASALQAQIEREGAGQALYAALAVALGQTANRHAFAELAARLPLAAVTADLALPAGDPDEAERPPAGSTARHATDMDGGEAAGGATVHRPVATTRLFVGPGEGAAAAVIERRLRHAAGLDGALLTPGPAIPWVIHGRRPAAAPGRRIAALARLVARLQRPDLVAGARALVDRAHDGGVHVLLRDLTVQAAEGPALCGRGRAVELAVNALLPWAAACAALAGDEDAAGAALALAGLLPVVERYGAVAHLHRNLRDARGRPIIASALLQQGALALLTEWCRRGGCGRCPLS